MDAAVRTTFIDPSSFPFLSPLRDGWQVIASELAASLGEAYVVPYSQPDFLAPGSQWHMLQLSAWGLDVPHNLVRMPATADLIRATPRLMQVAIYALGPRSHITPHHGLVGRVLRAHLGLRCPPGCVLRVADDLREEVDGGLLVFDDTQEHEAYNRSDEWRFVLHLDFFRPEIEIDDALSAWLTEYRISLAKSAPRLLPGLIAAGVELDPEIAHWFRASQAPLGADSGYAAHDLAAFDAWLRACAAVRGP